MAEEEKDAKKQDKKKDKASGEGGVSKSASLTLWLSIVFVVLVILSLPTVIVLFFGMLPTIVSGIVDRSPSRHATFCIGGINLCGVFPYMIELWLGDNSLQQGIGMITNVFSLVIMYGAAALGWMIFQSLPPIIAAFVTVIAQSRVSRLRSGQRKLIEEWGEDVGLSDEDLELREHPPETPPDEPASGSPPAQALNPMKAATADTDSLLDGIDDLLAGGGAPPGKTG